jgi:hypothetical protein
MRFGQAVLALIASLSDGADADICEIHDADLLSTAVRTLEVYRNRDWSRAVVVSPTNHGFLETHITIDSLIPGERSDIQTERDRLIDTHSELSRHRPEFRFGQLIQATTSMVRPAGNESVYDVEDAELLDAATRLLLSRPQSTSRAA